jgi:hypothetical protein
MSLLHLAAVLDDGGALAQHLIATQPWAPWAWVSLSWAPPMLAGAAADATGGAAAAATMEEGVEADGTVPLPQRPAQLTPGSLSMLLGQTEPLECAVSRLVLRDDDLVAVGEAEVVAVVAAVGESAAADGPAVAAAQGQQEQDGDGGLTAAVAEMVESWGRLSAALMQALCEQLERQRL